MNIRYHFCILFLSSLYCLASDNNKTNNKSQDADFTKLTISVFRGNNLEKEIYLTQIITRTKLDELNHLINQLENIDKKTDIGQLKVPTSPTKEPEWAAFTDYQDYTIASFAEKIGMMDCSQLRVQFIINDKNTSDDMPKNINQKVPTVLKSRIMLPTPEDTTSLSIPIIQHNKEIDTIDTSIISTNTTLIAVYEMLKQQKGNGKLMTRIPEFSPNKILWVAVLGDYKDDTIKSFRQKINAQDYCDLRFKFLLD